MKYVVQHGMVDAVFQKYMPVKKCSTNGAFGEAKPISVNVTWNDADFVRWIAYCLIWVNPSGLWI